jgi:integrase
MIDTGIRRAEIVSLTWADLDTDTGLLRVFNTKGGKPRVVFAGRRTRRALAKLPRRGVVIFPLTGAGIRSAPRHLGDRAGLRVSPHVLRRTFATLATTAGMPLAILQNLMGHASIEMTRRYIQLTGENIVAAALAYGPIDSL